MRGFFFLLIIYHLKSDKFTLNKNVMVTHSELLKNADYEVIHCSLSGGTNCNYACTDYMHTFTGEVVTTVEMQVNEVGKDELDALYRIQRIIEDKIHEARMRPVVDEVVSDDSDTCSGVDTYPDDNHPFG